MMTALKGIGIAVLAVVVLTGLWFGGWALARANQAQQYDVNTGGQQYQSGLVSQERDRVTAYGVATDPGQKKAIANQFCAVYEELVEPIPEDLVLAHSDICD